MPDIKTDLLNIREFKSAIESLANPTVILVQIQDFKTRRKVLHYHLQDWQIRDMMVADMATRLQKHKQIQDILARVSPDTFGIAFETNPGLEQKWKNAFVNIYDLEDDETINFGVGVDLVSAHTALKAENTKKQVRKKCRWQQ